MAKIFSTPFGAGIAITVDADPTVTPCAGIPRGSVVVFDDGAGTPRCFHKHDDGDTDADNTIEFVMASGGVLLQIEKVSLTTLELSGTSSGWTASGNSAFIKKSSGLGGAFPWNGLAGNLILQPRANTTRHIVLGTGGPSPTPVFITYPDGGASVGTTLATSPGKDNFKVEGEYLSGVATPSGLAGRAHFMVAGGTPVTPNAQTVLTLQRSQTAAHAATLLIVAGNTAYSRIGFGDTDNPETSSIDYNHSSEQFEIRAGGYYVGIWKGGVGLELRRDNLTVTDGIVSITASAPQTALTVTTLGDIPISCISTDATSLFGIQDSSTTGAAYVGVGAIGDVLQLRANNVFHATLSGIAFTLPTVDLTVTLGKTTLGGDLAHTGTKLGHYGTAPIVKQTGVAVTTAAVHAALVNVGLIAA